MSVNAVNGRRAGLSMPEMVFAMTMLFLVATFVMSMFVTGSRQMAQASQSQDLASLARTQLSRIQSMDWTDLDSLPTTPTALPAPNDQYQWYVSQTGVDGKPPSKARLIELTMTHPTHGSRVMRTVRSLLPPPPPGQEAFEKFACHTCHSLPAAGYPEGPGLVPLGPIGALNPSVTRPGGSPAAWEQYIKDSISDPNGFDAFPAGGGTDLDSLVMLDVDVEGVDATYDPNSDISAQEFNDMATWLAGFQP